MSNCVNTNTEEFQNLASATNMNPIILAAKVSLWQESNGLDKFPTDIDILNAGQEDLDYSLGEEKESPNYTNENYHTFQRTYISQERLDLARESLTNFLENRLGADSYHINYEGNKIKSITIKPTGKVTSVAGLENTAQNLFKNLKNIAHPSYNIFSLQKKAGEAYSSTIKVNYNKDFIQAYALGLERLSLEDFKKERINRFRETMDLDTFIIPANMSLEEMKEYVENAKQSEQLQFQGAYSPFTGEVMSYEDFLKSLDENIKGIEATQEEEDLDYNIVSNTNSVLIDPTYSYYEEQRKKQIRTLDTRIQALENRRNIEGHTAELNTAIVSLRNLKKSFEDDLSVYNKTIDKEELIKNFFNKDFQLVENLLSSPSVENFFIAEDAVEFITLNLDFTSHEEGIFRKENEEQFSPSIDNFLKDARHNASNLKIKVDNARDNYFEDILNKYETNLSSLYPGKSIAEIKNQVLQNLEDIYWAESQLLPVNRNLFSESDMIAQLLRLEFEYQVHKIKPAGQRLIQKINTLIPSVEKALVSLGIPSIKTTVLGRKIPDYTQLFYRKDKKGHLTSELVSRYSLEWEKYSRGLIEYDNNLREARLLEDWNKLETILNDKYYNLKHNTEFVDFRLLADIDTHLSPEGLAYMKSIRAAATGDATAYSEKLKTTLGSTEYKDLVKNQAFKIEEFLLAKNNYLRDFMKKEGVTNFNALSPKSKLNLDVITKRLDPNEFLTSHFNNNSNDIPYTVGTQTYTKKHYMSYNSFIPRSTNSTGDNTDYFDSAFDTINNNPDLKNFWETLEEAVIFINNNLTDSSLRLKPRTILHLKKSMIENLMGKGFSSSLQGVTGEAVWENTKGLVKDIISQKNSPKLKSKEIILPSNVASFNQLVNADFNMTKVQLSNLLKQDIDTNTTLNWNSLLETQKNSIYEILGINNLQDFSEEITLNSKGQFKVSALKVFNEKAIMEQQTVDLPSLLKSFIELSMLHKARVEARDSARILLAESERVRNREGKNTEGPITTEDKKKAAWNTERTNANRRNKMFVKTVIENDTSLKGFGNISEKRRKKFEVASIEGKLSFLGERYYKNFSLDEKRIYKALLERSEFIKSKLENEEVTPEQKEKYEAELNSMEKKVTLMGKDYMASALYSNAINRTSRFAGLALNVAAMATNYLNARAAFFNRDGEFWPEGAGYAAFAFVDMGASRHVNPEYNKQWKTLEALIYQLDLIQDGTNELQKAQRTGALTSPKIWELKRWAQNPFYATELIEWYNQVPVILATGTAIEITHPTTGQVVPLFDGMGFPAHERDETTGRLKLKDEFRSEENIKDFENFDTPKMIQWKTLITTGINSLNGDYSLAGNILAKQTHVGQSIMMFKTWTGEYFHSRWAYQQKDLATGKVKDGFILGSIADKNTRKLGAAMLAGNTAGAAIMLPAAMAGIQAALFAPVLGTLLITGGLTYINRKRIKGAMENSLPSQLSFWDQLKYFSKVTTIGTVELPVNVMWSVIRFLTGSVTGKTLGKPALINIDASLGGKLTDPKAVTNLRNLTKIYQKSNLYMMIALMIELGLGDDEEDEKKGSSEWVAQELEKEENKPIYNLLRNLNTKMYNEENLGHNIIPAANLFIGDDATHMGPLEGAGKAVYYGVSGDTYEKEGMYLGDPKWQVNMRKTFLPSMIRNADKEEWAAGFENMMQDVYVKNTAVDKMFKTDLASDKSEVKQQRKEAREALKISLAQDEYDKDYNDLAPDERYQVDKKAEKQALREVPTPKRSDYNEEQEKIE